MGGGSYTGVPSNFIPGNPFLIHDMLDADPQAAAQYNQAFDKLADAIEWFRQNVPSNPIFGDGSDGNATMDGVTALNSFSTLAGGNYTLTRDVFFNNLTINANVTCFTGGFRVYVAGTLTMAAGAAFNAAGGNGLVQIGGAAGGSGGVLGAATGASGGTGGNVNVNGTNTSIADGVIGGNGGGGGNGNGGGGVGGTATAGAPASDGSIRVPSSYATGMLFGKNGAIAAQGGVGGGGGGGASAVNAGGGGGGGGGVVLVCALMTSLNAAAAFQAPGGNGALGNGAGAQASGPGGGGGGGVVIVVWHFTVAGTTAPGAGLANVAGGLAGTGGSATAANGFNGHSFFCQV